MRGNEDLMEEAREICTERRAESPMRRATDEAVSNKIEGSDSDSRRVSEKTAFEVK